MAKTHKGKFTPRNTDKYKGNPTEIIYRSGWELQMMMEFDKNPNVIEWSSECKIINYSNPITKRLHRYFPDFYVKQKTVRGDIETLIIEVKPMHEVLKPVLTRDKKSYAKKAATYIKNQAKWKAAKRYCEIHKYKFRVITKDKAERFVMLTEQELGL